MVMVVLFLCAKELLVRLFLKMMFFILLILFLAPVIK